LALSECNRARVCLVEGNLRRPTLAALFGFKPPACLAERLQVDRDRPLEPWRVAELSPSLHVLAVRESTPHQALVDGPAFGAGIEAMRRAGYRHIVIDGPEVLGIADMNLIEETVDSVLLVARGGVTAATDLSVAAGQLAGKKLRGLVLLDAE
jgi:Mrp family chromosome partitioning ATPase